MSSQRPRVTIYVPSHAYGHFLAQSLESVFRQSLACWELIIISDGSTDCTLEVAQQFAARAPEKVRVIANDVPMGLRACANTALELARGDYFMRLDADDFLDENALLVLSHFLDSHPTIGLVYPNWTFVDESGKALGIEYRKRAGSEDQTQDLPAHGACTLIRRRVLKAVGGYDTRFKAQDGHELWLKALHQFGIGNVETPLFFYRQHGQSMSVDSGALLASRRAIKAHIASGKRGSVNPRIAVIVPVKSSPVGGNQHALSALAGKALLDYTLDELNGGGRIKAGLVKDELGHDAHFASVLVSTDDAAVIAHCQRRADVHLHPRAAHLSDADASLMEVMRAAVQHLESELAIYPDIVVMLSINTPLRRLEHLLEAIDTLLLYQVDEVLSTWEDMDLHYRHDRQGMQAINPGMLQGLRLEREALYACNGSIHALWRENLANSSGTRPRIGHIIMSKTESLMAKKPEDRQLLELILSDRNAQQPKHP